METIKISAVKAGILKRWALEGKPTSITLGTSGVVRLYFLPRDWLETAESDGVPFEEVNVRGVRDEATMGRVVMGEMYAVLMLGSGGNRTRAAVIVPAVGKWRKLVEGE